MRATVLAASFLAGTFAQDDVDPFPPVQTDYDAIRYEFTIILNDDNDVLQVSEVGMVEWINTDASEFVLDLNNEMEVSSLTLDGEDLVFTHTDDRIVGTVPGGAILATSRFTVEYAGVPTDGLVIAETKFGARSFFGDNWPNRAHNWLACNDHPSDPATVGFTVTAPDQYDVIATGVEQSTVDNLDGTKTTSYSSDIDVPTKVMVIGVAEFAIRDLTGFSVPTSIWVYPENAEMGFSDYAPAGEIMEFLEETWGEFPYEKNVHVQSKTMFGGMENAGNIFYFEDSVSGTPPLSLIAHELGHQWFGDSASECEWNHIWLSEGFATYSANLWAEHDQGRPAMEARLAAERGIIINFQRENPENPVVCRSCYADLFALLNRLSYEKGGFVLHMLRMELGDDLFFSAIRTYYATFRDRCALTADLQEVVEGDAGLQAGELDIFFDQWVLSPGHPIFNGVWSAVGNVLTLTLEQVQQEWSTLFETNVDVAITLDSGEVIEETVRVQAERSSVFEVVLPATRTAVEVSLDPNTNLLFEGEMNPAPVNEESDSNALSGGAIAGIAVGCVVGIAVGAIAGGAITLTKKEDPEPSLGYKDMGSGTEV